MKPQTKFTLVLIASYSLFMLWWFLREEAPKPGAKPATVSTTAKVSFFDATGSAQSASSVDNRFLYTGREWIAEAHLYDYRNRVYSPVIGRFMQIDPIGFDAGDVNVYGYVFNNPINWADPTGEIGLDANGNLTWDGGDVLDVLAGFGTGIMQTLDALNPFDDPFKRGGWLGPCPEDNWGAVVAEWSNPVTVGAHYLKLQKAAKLAKKASRSGMTLADDMAILRQAKQGKGNFGLGSASHADAMRLGRSWVGDGYKVASDGKTLLSSDGLRQFRPPSLKPNSPHATTGTQANFEWRNVTSGQWQGNGHLNITP
jgi:RHS repeat-associated protein